jgi:hypothetical protein
MRSHLTSRKITPDMWTVPDEALLVWKCCNKTYSKNQRQVAGRCGKFLDRSLEVVGNYCLVTAPLYPPSFFAHAFLGLDHGVGHPSSRCRQSKHRTDFRRTSLVTERRRREDRLCASWPPHTQRIWSAIVMRVTVPGDEIGYPPGRSDVMIKAF